MLIYSGWEGKGGAGCGRSKISFSKFLTQLNVYISRKNNFKSKREQTANCNQNRKMNYVFNMITIS